MKTPSKSFRQSLIAVALLCLVPFTAKADDCSFGDCFLLRQAVQDQKTLVDDYRRSQEIRVGREEKEREEEKQLAKQKERDVRSSVVLAEAKAKGPADGIYKAKKHPSKITRSNHRFQHPVQSDRLR